jgi:hypothetical protein
MFRSLERLHRGGFSMDDQLNEIKGMIKGAVAAGMKKLKDSRFKKQQAIAKEGNVKLKAMFDPKSSYQPPIKQDLQPGRRARADIAMTKLAKRLK